MRLPASNRQDCADSIVQAGYFAEPTEPAGSPFPVFESIRLRLSSQLPVHYKRELAHVLRPPRSDARLISWQNQHRSLLPAFIPSRFIITTTRWIATSA